MCHEAGVVLAFLPPYSPDYNPIGESSSGLKAWLRRHRALAEGFDGEFPAFIQMAVHEYIAGGNPEGHFRNSFINCNRYKYDNTLTATPHCL